MKRSRPPVDPRRLAVNTVFSRFHKFRLGAFAAPHLALSAKPRGSMTISLASIERFAGRLSCWPHRFTDITEVDRLNQRRHRRMGLT